MITTYQFARKNFNKASSKFVKLKTDKNAYADRICIIIGFQFDEFAAGLIKVFSSELVSGYHSRLIIKFCC